MDVRRRSRGGVVVSLSLLILLGTSCTDTQHASSRSDDSAQASATSRLPTISPRPGGLVVDAPCPRDGSTAPPNVAIDCVSAIVLNGRSYAVACDPVLPDAISDQMLG